MPIGYAIVIRNEPLTIDTEHRLDVEQRGAENYTYRYPLDVQIRSVRINGQRIDIGDVEEIVITFEGSL